MGSLIAIAMLASAAPQGAAVPAVHAPTKAVASAQASVRILPGAKVSLNAQAETQGYKLNAATITAEDGSRRSAKLIEFQ